MTIRRLPDPPADHPVWDLRRSVCYHREHNPPTMIYLRPGRYEHTCPGCHKSTIITVQGSTFAAIR